jgi:hypothetical protein
MDTQNQTSIKPPVIPTGQEIFDAIMGQIEPELTSVGVKTLEAKYKNETATDSYERRKRYALAYERYEKAYDETMATLHTQVDRYRRSSFAQVEQEDRANESTAFDAITHQLAA